MDAYNEQMREQALAEYDERAARSEYYTVESFGSFVRFAVEHELEASDMAALIEKYGLYPQIVSVANPDYTARRSLAWPIITFGAEKLVADALGCTQKSLKECASEFSDYFGEASDELKERFDHMVEDEDLPRGMRLVKGSAGLPAEVAWSVSRPVAGAVSAACTLEPAEGEEGPVYTWGVVVNGKLAYTDEATSFAGAVADCEDELDLFADGVQGFIDELEDYMVDVVKPVSHEIAWEDGSETVTVTATVREGQQPFSAAVRVLLPEEECSFADEVRVEVAAGSAAETVSCYDLTEACAAIMNALAVLAGVEKSAFAELAAYAGKLVPAKKAPAKKAPAKKPAAKRTSAAKPEAAAPAAKPAAKPAAAKTAAAKKTAAKPAAKTATAAKTAAKPAAKTAAKPAAKPAAKTATKGTSAK